MRRGGEGLEEEGRERGKIGSVLTLLLPSLPIPPPVTCPDPTQDGKVSSYHQRRLSKSTKRSDGSEVEKCNGGGGSNGEAGGCLSPLQKIQS